MPFLEVSTSIGCPMRCSYCPQDKIGAAYTGPRLMRFETFADALANCPPGLPVSFAGYAEPYLNPMCSGMVEHADALGHPVLVYTTGVGLGELDVELLIQVQPRILMLHLPDGDGDMKAKVTPEYVDRVRRLAANVRSFQCVWYGTPHPMLGEFDQYRKGYGLHSRAGNVVKMGKPLRQIGPLKCRPAPGLDENVLIPTGELAICCNDYGLTHLIGDLTRQTWEDIHAGPRLARIREAMADRSPVGLLCSTCEFAEPAA